MICHGQPFPLYIMHIPIENLDDSFFTFINDHMADDTASMRMKRRGDDLMQFAVTQIECRRRCEEKLRDTLERVERFVFPSDIAAQQSTSDAVAAFHAGLVGEGRRVLDLTCGLGIDTFAMARNGCRVTAVELDGWKSYIAGYNARVSGLSERVEIVNDDSVELVRRMAAPKEACRYDDIFVDPARRDEAGNRVYGFHDCSPDILTMLDSVAALAPRLVVKASPMLDITQCINDFEGRVNRVYIVGSGGECKEVVIDVAMEGQMVDPDYVAVCVIEATHDCVAHETFRFTHREEREAASAILQPEALSSGMFLYEPSAPAMKTGAFKSLGARFGLEKVSVNTHLYCCNHMVEGFPGTVYKVANVTGMSKRELSLIINQYGHINVAVRNMGMTAAALKAKLKVADGGDPTVKLIGMRDSAGNRRLVIAERLSR